MAQIFADENKWPQAKAERREELRKNGQEETEVTENL
jgi:hypothetical protein